MIVLGFLYALNGVLPLGASAVVSFSVDVARELKILDRNFKWVVEPGDFKVLVGGSSEGASEVGTFTVV